MASLATSIWWIASGRWMWHLPLMAPNRNLYKAAVWKFDIVVSAKSVIFYCSTQDIEYSVSFVANSLDPLKPHIINVIFSNIWKQTIFVHGTVMLSTDVYKRSYFVLSDSYLHELLIFWQTISRTSNKAKSLGCSGGRVFHKFRFMSLHADAFGQNLAQMITTNVEFFFIF